jgi:hypothetical protein
LAADSLSVTFAGIYQHRPLTLTAPSPDAKGREILLVEHVVDTQTLIHAGLGHAFDLGVALRTVAYQTGTGIGAARSRIGSTLEQQVVRDPLAGIGYAFADSTLGTAVYQSKLRADFSLPLGDANHFAGEAGVVWAPSLLAELSWSRISLAGQFGARFRRAVTLGDVRYGQQLLGTLGLVVAALPEQLFVAGELTAAPSLQRQPLTASGERGSWIPAEWAVTTTAQWSEVYALSFSAGGGVPMSSQHIGSREGELSEEHFMGLGAPSLRFVLMLRMTNADF